MRWKMLLLAMLPVFATVGESYADDFYKGKTIRVIVGGSAGGGFDIYTRAMARHMGKHIPGNPSLLVENMTGAGTLIAAKFLHSSAKPDGLAFGIFNGALILSGALGNKSVDFDMPSSRRAVHRRPRRASLRWCLCSLRPAESAN